MNPQRNKRWMAGILFIPGILLFFTVELILAQSSENYQIIKSVIDQGGAPSQSVNYHVVDAVGESVVYKASSVNYSLSSGFFGGHESGYVEVEKSDDAVLPDEFKLLQNYPNPFNPITHIEYHLPQTAEVNLTIFNIQGHVVRQLVQGRISAGHHIAVWDGTNAAGKTVASGMYFYTLITGSYKDTKKMLFLE